MVRVPEQLHQHFSQAVGDQTRGAADRVAAALAGRGPLDDAYLDALRPAGYRLTDEPRTDDPGLEFTPRVSLLAGRRDRIGGYRDPFAALSRYPNGSLTVLPAAGHYLPFEQPERFAALILDWLTPEIPAQEA